MTEGRRLRHRRIGMRNRKLARALIFQVKRSRGCEDCKGTNIPIDQLTFHHRDPRTKREHVSRLASMGKSLAIIQAEIDKCDVLCRDCHDEREAIKSG